MHTQGPQSRLLGDFVEALGRPLFTSDGGKKQVHHGRRPARRVAQHRLSNKEPTVWGHGIAQVVQDLNTLLIAEIVETAADNVYQGA